MNALRELVDGQATVVWADLDANLGPCAVLSCDELERAGRFKRSLDRDRWVACRSILRQLLGQRLGEDPAGLVFVTGSHGKPRLLGAPTLAFNVTHSEGDALFAFSDAGWVGVDLEHVRPLDPVRLSRTVFSAEEQDELLRLDADTRLTAFYDGWVRKEAVVKADGRGLRISPDSFSVSLSSPARLLSCPSGEELARWRLQSLRVGGLARAALATYG